MGFDTSKMSGLTAASGGLQALSAFGSIASGFAQRDEANAEAQQYERNAQLARIGADQQASVRQLDLNNTLSAIQAMRTARGLDPASPTGEAIDASVTNTADQVIGAETLNAANQAQSYSTQAAILRNQGKMSLLSGFLQAGSGLAKAGLTAFGA